MKKSVLLLAVVLAASFASNAQDKKISIGLGFGGASASAKSDGESESGFGINGYLNGMYNVNSNISVGLEYNSNFVVIGSLDGAEIKATKINGILAKGKYAFGDGGAKPFVGVMAGLYTMQPGSVTIAGSNIGIVFETKSSFGFAPEVGIQLGSFQLATSYHIVGKYSAELQDIIGTGTTTVETNYNIWQFNIGWNIGLINN